jgi:PilZ domain/SPOR domain
MPIMDRRHAPRTTLDQLAYISIEPDNGGIVLNVSGEGLGFHSMVPVNRNGALRLSLQEQNRRIDISSELVWTNDAQKIGGVRFTSLNKEARARILDWTRKSARVPGASFTLGSALKRNTPQLVSSFSSPLSRWKSNRRLKVSGFAKGLASGFLLSLIAFSIVLFSYGHRREFGESLIRLGKRLAASGDSKAPAQLIPPSGTTAPQTTPRTITASGANPSPNVQTVSDSRSAHNDTKQVAQNPLPHPVQHTEAIPMPLNAGADKRHESGFSSAQSLRSEPEPRMLASANSASSAISLLPMPHLPLSIAKPQEQLPALIQSQPVVIPVVAASRLNPRSNVQMFFDLGRFNKEWLAQQLTEKLAQLGVHATVVPKRRLWTNFYQVLVGPYDNEAAEQQLSHQLLSHGYKPRPFERGTRDFAFQSRLSIDRSPLPTGAMTIAWESYIADAKVKFTQGGDLITAVDGKWIKRAAKFSQDEYVYQIQADGSRPLLEVHFAGMDRILVFRNLP